MRADSDRSVIEAYSYCESVTRRHAKSFHFAASFLPHEKRSQVFPIYAFCRHVDDEIDEIPDGDEVAAVEAVERWRSRLEALYAEQYDPDAETDEGKRNVFIAWRHMLRSYSIPIEHPLDLIKGVVQDTYKKRYDNFQELYEYSYRVASTVGLMSSEILGYSEPRALEFAEAMGIGMQLTNILRDIKEDAERGRIYLPKEDLERFGLDESEILDGKMSDRFRQMMIFQVERARGFYSKGEQGIPMLDADSRFTVLLASRVYGRILKQIERLDYNVFLERASTSKVQKLMMLPGIWLESRKL
jgi:15-cis-phytoene synthase